jgi:hypothetical protein
MFEEMPKGVDPNNVTLIGDCLKRSRGKGVGHWSAGCPPLEPHPLWLIIDRVDHIEMEPAFRERMARDEEPWIRFIEKLKEEKHAATG